MIFERGRICVVPSMTKEDREDQFVVTPLIDWFKKQKPKWGLHKPAYASHARGWDIEAKRDNEYLVIEAKCISASSISSFAGLVAAPLAKRDNHWRGPSWCCWAIGIKPQVERDRRHVYQIFFDYMARNPTFWGHYGKDLRMKYIFFVQAGGVTSILFTEFLRKTKLYSDRAQGKTVKARRRIAEEVMSAPDVSS
jgi:hypothetical protein